MTTNVVFRGTTSNARRAIGQFIGMLSGRNPDHGRLARSVFLVVGMAALADIQQDFLKKSRGGVGDDGVKWPPLSKEYLAYGRRFGKGEQAKLKKQAGLGRQHNRGTGRNGGLLSASQQKRWNQLYAQSLAWMAARYPIDEARAMAAGHAWNKIKEEGAKTKLEVYGNRQVDMLRDTGVMFNSLSPGHLSPDGTYSPPDSNQIFEAIANGIVVGTKVPYADAQNKKRRFIPDEVPATWQQRWELVLIGAIVSGMRMYLFDQGGQAA